MKYTPDSEGKFAGQNGYGYRSIALFVGMPHVLFLFRCPRPSSLPPHLPFRLHSLNTFLFLEAASSIRCGKTDVTFWRNKLAAVQDTLAATAVLEAGRRSLDNNNRRVGLQYNDDGEVIGFD